MKSPERQLWEQMLNSNLDFKWTSPLCLPLTQYENLVEETLSTKRKPSQSSLKNKRSSKIFCDSLNIPSQSHFRRFNDQKYSYCT
jgi:hypothetical protein